MGIPLSSFKYMLLESKRNPFRGRALTLGRQGIFITRSELMKAFETYGLKFPSLPEDLFSRRQKAKGLEGNPEYVDDEVVFRSLGFTSVEALDCSDYEKAEIVHDLNHPLPTGVEGAYDFVFDGGTLEHIFDVKTALINAAKLLKVGGRIHHAVPTSNFVDHGFYQFSPTVLLDYYAANGFEVNSVHLCELSQFHDLEAWKIYEYPFDSALYSFAGLRTDSGWGTLIIVTRLPESTFDNVPLQGDHLKVLGGNGASVTWTGAGWRQDQRKVDGKTSFYRSPWSRRLGLKRILMDFYPRNKKVRLLQSRIRRELFDRKIPLHFVAEL